MKIIVKFIFGALSVISTSYVLADSVFLNNPDELEINISADGNTLKTSNEQRFYLNIDPANKSSYIINVPDSGISNLTLKTSNGAPEPYQCNYALVVSRDDGWKLDTSGSSTCTPSENHYRQPSYIIINNSTHVVYPAFEVDGYGYSADSIFGYLTSNALRTYAVGDAYWKAIHIELGTKVSVAVFDPYQGGGYIKCSDTAPVGANRKFTYHKDHTCSENQPTD